LVRRNIEEPTMTDTSGRNPIGSVLRPFEETPAEPLPPVEPSKVVPVDRMPRAPESITPEDVIEAENEPPVEGPVNELVERPTPEASAEGDETEHDETDGFWGPEGTDEELDDDFLAGPLADPSLFADGEEVAGDEASGDEEEGDELDGDEAADDVDEPIDVGPTAPVDKPASGTVTLPRKPFLVGLGVVGIVLLVLVALWQTAGGEGDTVDPGDASQAPLDETPDPNGDDLDDDGSFDDPAGDVADLESDITGLNAEISGLEAQVETVQAKLDDQPPPSLPGDSLLRVPVPSGSKFVSAEGQSISVVSPFGGYANIETQSNVVNASGNVADGGTRVLRTPTSVWITNYADSQLIRVDPQANTVADVFAFPAPDGLAKYGDALLVASFDGEFLGGVDPTDGEIVEQVALGGKPTDIVVRGDHIWVTLFDTGEIVKINAADFFVEDRLVIGAGPVGIWSTDDGLWVANHEEGTVVQVDPRAVEVVQTIEVGDGPTDVIGAFGNIWVTVTDAGDLVEIEAGSGDIVSRTPLGGTGLGGGPVGLEHAAGSLWIAMDRESSVVRVTPPA
jgi:streptogramin lyase